MTSSRRISVAIAGIATAVLLVLVGPGQTAFGADFDFPGFPGFGGRRGGQLDGQNGRDGQDGRTPGRSGALGGEPGERGESGEADNLARQLSPAARALSSARHAEARFLNRLARQR